jgi:hypothetical protein
VKVYDCAQRSPEWHALRVGMVGGSCASEILATRRDGKEASARRDLRLRIACERLTGQTQEDKWLGGLPGDMVRGMDLEPEAVLRYESRTGNLVRPVGFVVMDDGAAGCSPDGVIGNYDGIIEIKAPRAAIHLGYWDSGSIPTGYRPQLVHNLLVTGAPWCDFVSYCPFLPEALQLLVIRMDRNEAEIASYELLLRQFLSEVDLEIERVKALCESAA